MTPEAIAPSGADKLSDMARNSLSNLNPSAVADQAKYDRLLSQYGISAPKQAVGGNADMGTRFVDNMLGNRGSFSLSDSDKDKYTELLLRYGVSDMDWTNRRRKNILNGGI